MTTIIPAGHMPRPPPACRSASPRASAASISPPCIGRACRACRLSDWLALGHTREELDALIAGAPDWIDGDDRQQQQNVVLTLQEWLVRDLPEPDYILGNWLTTTSRALLVAPTELGKTMFGIALGMRTAANRCFLNWQGSASRTGPVHRSQEVLQRLLKQRLADEVKRLGGVQPEGMHILSHEDFEIFPPLNTPEGKAVIGIRPVNERIGGVDLICFDNIKSLIGGNMREEEDWRQTIHAADL